MSPVQRFPRAAPVLPSPDTRETRATASHKRSAPAVAVGANPDDPLQQLAKQRRTTRSSQPRSPHTAGAPSDNPGLSPRPAQVEEPRVRQTPARGPTGPGHMPSTPASKGKRAAQALETPLTAEAELPLRKQVLRKTAVSSLPSSSSLPSTPTRPAPRQKPEPVLRPSLGRAAKLKRGREDAPEAAPERPAKRRAAPAMAAPPAPVAPGPMPGFASRWLARLSRWAPTGISGLFSGRAPDAAVRQAPAAPCPPRFASMIRALEVRPQQVPCERALEIILDPEFSSLAEPVRHQAVSALVDLWRAGGIAPADGGTVPEIFAAEMHVANDLLSRKVDLSGLPRSVRPTQGMDALLPLRDPDDPSRPDPRYRRFRIGAHGRKEQTAAKVGDAKVGPGVTSSLLTLLEEESREPEGKRRIDLTPHIPAEDERWDRVNETKVDDLANRLAADVKRKMHAAFMGHAIKNPACEVRQRTAKDVAPGEEALIGQNGLFLRLEEGTPVPKLSKGRIIGLFSGVAIKTRDKDAIAAHARKYGAKDYHRYGLSTDKQRKDLDHVTFSPLGGGANSMAFVDTALNLDGPTPQYDRSRINALFLPFNIDMTTADGEEVTETVFALVALDNIGDGDLRVGYADDYLDQFQPLCDARAASAAAPQGAPAA